MWRILPLLAVLGCNRVLGLDPTAAIDAGSLADEDADGIADLVDNCPSVPNPDQHNEDGDSAGDRCDDCALIANTQGADDDEDGVGDLSDPQPTTAGDCLLVVESFRDPEAFAASWEVITPPAAGTIEHRVDEIELRPTAEPVTIVDREATGLVDVIVRARTTTRSGLVAAASNLTGVDSLGCALAQKELSIQAVGPGVVNEVTQPLFPQSHVGDAVMLRLTLVADTLGFDVVVGCRVDYGIATGIDIKGYSDLPSEGRAGVAASLEPVVIEAIALLQHSQTGATCPSTRYR